jgi:hypothetical protein
VPRTASDYAADSIRGAVARYLAGECNETLPLA